MPVKTKHEREQEGKLQEQLTVQMKKQMSSSSSAAAAQIAKLQDQADTCTRKIEMERRRSEELDKQIAAMEENVRAQRKRMGGVNASQENHMQIAKQIKILENRLEKALQKFNAALAHNTSLRQEIDNTRRERVVFDEIYKQLEQELSDKRTEMAGIIDAANEAYASRDKAQARMAQLKMQADQEQAAFEEQWKDLGELIEEDRKRKNDFMKKQKHDSSVSTASLAEEGFDEESKMRKKVIAKNWGIAKQVAAQQVSQEKAKSYQEAFKRIQHATGITEIDELVTTFTVANENNHNAMTMVGLINDEIDKIALQNAEIKADIEKYRQQSENAERHRKKILEALDDKLAKTKVRMEQYDERYTAAQKASMKMRERVEDIFDGLGCWDAPESEMLDRDEGCTDANMMQFLAIIEERVVSVVQSGRRRTLHGYHGRDQHAVNLSAGIFSQTAKPLKINPPSTGDHFASSDEEEEGQAFSRKDMKERSMRAAGRRSPSSPGKKKSQAT